MKRDGLVLLSTAFGAAIGFGTFGGAFGELGGTGAGLENGGSNSVRLRTVFAGTSNFAFADEPTPALDLPGAFETEKPLVPNAGSSDFRTVEPGEFELSPDEESDETTGEPSETPKTADGDVPELVPTPLPNPQDDFAAVPELDATPETSPGAEIDEAEMRRLSRDPLFKEFSAAFDEAAPLPETPNLGATTGEPLLPATPFAIPNADAPSTGDATTAKIGKDGKPAPILSGRSVALLDETLAIADVDLTAAPIPPERRALFERLDAEIARLSERWIDAELNRNVVGRRERIWERNAPNRFDPNDPEPVAVASDWALAPAAPFFFQVVVPESGSVLYTKAGDFEPLDDGSVGLVRDAGVYLLTVEPGPVVPSGRSERTRVLPNGRVQGVDAAGTRVVDFNLGAISLFLFDNPERLASEDGVFFVPTAESGEPRQAKLPPNASALESGKLLLSNGRPDELFARLAVLCKSKRRLVEILTQPRLDGTAADPDAANGPVAAPDLR